MTYSPGEGRKGGLRTSDGVGDETSLGERVTNPRMMTRFQSDINCILQILQFRNVFVNFVKVSLISIKKFSHLRTGNFDFTGNMSFMKHCIGYGKTLAQVSITLDGKKFSRIVELLYIFFTFL